MIRRGKLSKLYTTFIRPVFEYSSVAEDGCTLYEKRKVQLSAAIARIVLTLPSFWPYRITLFRKIQRTYDDTKQK